MEVRRSGSRHNTTNVVAPRSVSKKHHTFKPTVSSLKKEESENIDQKIYLTLAPMKLLNISEGLILQKRSSKNL